MIVNFYFIHSYILLLKVSIEEAAVIILDDARNLLINNVKQLGGYIVDKGMVKLHIDIQY